MPPCVLLGHSHSEPTDAGRRGSNYPQAKNNLSQTQLFASPDQLSHLEAVLFLASQPLSSRKLAQLVHLSDGTAARTMIKELNTLYESSVRSFRVEEVAGGYQLRTQKIFAPWIRKMVSVPSEIRMSGPAMETLAVVAYRQPVMRTDIEKVRGVQCGEILRQLMERGMVRISGRADELGRPFLYGTTRNFLEVFGLRSLDELPRASMLRANEDASERESMTEEGIEVSVRDATDLSKRSNDQQTLSEVPVATTEDDFDDDLDQDDDDLDDDDLKRLTMTTTMKRMTMRRMMGSTMRNGKKSRTMMTPKARMRSGRTMKMTMKIGMMMIDQQTGSIF